MLVLMKIDDKMCSNWQNFDWFSLENSVDFWLKKKRLILDMKDKMWKKTFKKKSIEIDWNFKHFQSRLKKSISVDFFNLGAFGLSVVSHF